MKQLLIALEKRTLKAKLLLGFLILMLLSVAIGIDALIGLRRVTGEMQYMYEKELLGISAIKEARLNYVQIGRIIRQVILARDPAERERSLKQLADVESGMKKAIDETRQRSFRDEVKRDLAKFEDNYSAYRRNVDRAIGLVQNGKIDEAQAYVASMDFQRPGIAVNEILGEMARIKEVGSKEALQKGLAAAEHEEFTTFLWLFGGLGLGLIGGALIARSIRQPIGKIRESVEQLARGHLNDKVPHTDYPNEIGDLARAIAVLQNEARQMEAQRWVKSHIAEISSELQQVSSFTDLSKVFLARIAPLIKLGHGVFYIYEQDSQRLRLLGGYAYRERKNLDQYFSLGQGLVGQCALERAPIFITEPPEDYVRIGSSLGEGVPRTIAVLPVLRTERLLAILELATFGTFGPNEQALLDGVMPILAMSLEILERNVKTKQLLEETQRQAENMEKQAARLEEQAVEMEAQQHEIKATEERSRLILGSVNDGIVGLDNNGVMTFANAAAYTMLGYAEEEFIGHGMHALVHHRRPDGSDFPREECAMYCTAQDGQPRVVDNEVLWRKDGTSIPVEYSTTPVLKDGVLVGTVIVYRDITERKTNEQRLLHANQEQVAIFESLTHGIGFIKDRVILRANSKHAELFGREMSEIEGHSTRVWYPNDEAFALGGEAVKKDLAQGITHVREQQLMRKDGSLFWCHISARAVDPNDLSRGLVCVLEDVTERKRMEEEMKRANFLTDIALELTGSGYWYVDYAHPDRYFQSERAARILGEHIKEDGLYDLDAEWFARLQEANPETAELTAERYQGAIDGKYDKYVSVYAYKRPVDGNIVWVAAAGKLVRDETTNKILFMYGAYQDITDIKRAEKELKHINMMTDSALDLTKAGYWLIDYSDPEYYTSSERAAAIFGEYPTEGWRYHLTEEWYNRIVDADPAVAEATSAHYAAAVAGSVPRYDCTYCYKRPIDGQVAWIRAIGNVTRDKNGKPLIMYGVSQDVTALRLSEAKLEERMGELERFNRLTIDREEKMIELKKEINELLTQSGQESKYRIVS